jgi:hypothetical protein
MRLDSTSVGKSVIPFAILNQNNPSAKIYDGIWNGKGQLNGTAQRAICYNGYTAFIDKVTGQIIDFYEGTKLGGLINITEVQ